MRPEFSNTIGIARKANAAGKTVELQLDFMLSYMETESQLTKEGPVTASVRKNEQLSSVLLTRDSMVALIASLRKTLGSEFEEIIEFCEACDEMQQS